MIIDNELDKIKPTEAELLLVITAKLAEIEQLRVVVAKLNTSDFETQFRATVHEYAGPAVPGAVDLAVLSALEAKRPPSNNMGATPPLTPLNFPHCEKSPVFDVQKTSIDWLAYSTTVDIEAIFMGLQVVWPEMQLEASKAGMRGYAQCKALTLGGVQFGLIGYGQKHGRASVSLTGTACKTLTHEMVVLLHEMLVVVDARISRVDICFDFYRGECTWDDAYEAFQLGEFKTEFAPKNPSHFVLGGKGPDGENLGRTLYIGPRDGEKYGRVYEKGLEVFAKMSEEYRLACTERELSLSGETEPEVMGTIADTWVRLEGEFKRKHKDRPILLEVLLERDAYFSGAYPFFARMLQKGTGKGRGSLPSDKTLNHDKLIMAHRNAYGNHVYTLLERGFTPVEVCAILNTGKHNQRLLKSGLIDVETSAVRAFRAEALVLGPDDDIPF